MTEMVKRSIRCGLIGALALGALAGVANAQEGEDVAQHIQNVLLTFHLVQADGFTDEDPEISDVVSELREIFNFQGYRLLSTSVFNVGLIPNTSGSRATGEGLQRIYPIGFEKGMTIKANVSSRRSTGTVRATVTLTDQIRQSYARGEELPLLETTVTFRDGQRAVLGSGPGNAEGAVLILIVTPRIDP